MFLRSVSKLWNRLAGKPLRPTSSQANESEAPLNRAWRDLRREEVRIPSWGSIERFIHNEKGEQQMAISRARLLAVSRRMAFVGATAVAVLLVFFAVPFSQTSELGSTIVFEFSPPLPPGTLPADCSALLQGADDDLGGGQAKLCMKVKNGTAGLEMMEITQVGGGMSPEELIQKMTSEYPFLNQAQITINPITEQESGTMFNRLCGKLKVDVECEGKTAAEIEQLIRQTLAADGVNPEDVHVEKTDDGRVKIKISAECEEGG